MLKAVREGEGRVAADEFPALQAFRHEGDVALARAPDTVVIQEQAPAAVGKLHRGRGFIKSGLDLLHRNVEGRHAFKGPGHMVGRKLDDPLRVPLALDKKVVLPVFFVHPESMQPLSSFRYSSTGALKFTKSFVRLIKIAIGP